MDWKAQDSEQHNLRKSNMLLIGSQGDLQASLRCSQMIRDVTGAMAG